MNELIQNNTLYISIKILMKAPYNYNYDNARSKIWKLKKHWLLYKINNARYFYLPVLYKYTSIYWYNIIWTLIEDWYIWLFSAAKKWGFVKQEHTSNIMYISDINKYSEFKYYYNKFKYYNYRLFKWYNNFLSFWVYTDANDIQYSDKEKTILDLVYYSLYSKYISIDELLFEKNNNLDWNIIEEYISYYPEKSQKRIISKLNTLNL